MHTGASGDSSPPRAFPRRGVRWLLTFAHFSRAGASGGSSPLHTFLHSGMSLAPRGPHITLNEWESRVLYTRLPLMWGWLHMNESVLLHMVAAECNVHSVNQFWQLKFNFMKQIKVSVRQTKMRWNSGQISNSVTFFVLVLTFFLKLWCTGKCHPFPVCLLVNLNALTQLIKMTSWGANS